TDEVNAFRGARRNFELGTTELLHREIVRRAATNSFVHSRDDLDRLPTEVHGLRKFRFDDERAERADVALSFIDLISLRVAHRPLDALYGALEPCDVALLAIVDEAKNALQMHGLARPV